MATAFIPIESFRTKFYQREKGSKGFLELSEEELATISKKVYKRQEIMDETDTFRAGRISKLYRYQRTLQYLTSPLIHLDLKTFDEKLAFLIMMSDPELLTFKEFLKLDLISMSDIAKVEDDKERKHLMQIREQSISGYQTLVREKLGFFDAKLLKFEEMFFNRFYGEKELITDVHNINPDNFIVRTKILSDFDSISDDRYEELVEVAKGWLSIASEQYNSKVATYSITNQKKLLGLKNLAEQATLFVLLVDPELDMLRIYEEESMMQNTESRIIEQFGYYNEELLTLEKKFHSRFCPDKQISIWTKIKKD